MRNVASTNTFAHLEMDALVAALVDGRKGKMTDIFAHWHGIQLGTVFRA